MKDLDNKKYCNRICVDCASALFFTNLNLDTDKSMLINAIKADYTFFSFAGKQLKSDFYFTLDCLKFSSKIINYVDESLIHNNNWIELAIKTNANSFCYLVKRDNKISHNIMLCIQASTLVKNINYFAEELFSNTNFLNLVIQQNELNIVGILKKADKINQNDLINLCLSAISKNAYVYTLMPNYLLTNIRFIQQAIISNSKVREYLPKQVNQFNLKINNNL